MQLIGHLVGQRAAKGPSAENYLAAASVVQDVLDIGLGTLLQRAFDALYAVNRHIFGQATGQWLVDHSGAAGWVEHEYGRTISLAQDADIAFYLGLQSFADEVGQGL